MKNMEKFIDPEKFFFDKKNALPRQVAAHKKFYKVESYIWAAVSKNRIWVSEAVPFTKKYLTSNNSAHLRKPVSIL